MLTSAILPYLRDYRFSFFYHRSFWAVFYLLPLTLTFFLWPFSFRQAFHCAYFNKNQKIDNYSDRLPCDSDFLHSPGLYKKSRAYNCRNCRTRIFLRWNLRDNNRKRTFCNRRLRFRNFNASCNRRFWRNRRAADCRLCR